MSPDQPQPRNSLIYVSGPPGAGKSTLMAHLTRHCHRIDVPAPVPHDVLLLPTAHGVTNPTTLALELGRRRAAFSGTDALAMNIISKAEEFLAGLARPYGLVLAEGDRLANSRFLGTAANLGWAVTLIHLSADREILDARCAQRGSEQSESWRRGRFTKAANLVAATRLTRTTVVELDARNSVECLALSAVAGAPILEVLMPVGVPERPAS